MKKLFDETFACGENEERIASRNIWYGYVELYEENEFGKNILLDESLIEKLNEIIKKDLLDESSSPTQTQWYIYGKTTTKDAIEDTIRPNIMILEKNKNFIVHCNISDNDFALNIDKVKLFQTNLENKLKK